MKRFILLVFVIGSCLSCGDFLKEHSQELTYATSCKDLSELLIGGGYMEYSGLTAGLSSSSGYYFPWIHVMDDDTRELCWGMNDGTLGSREKLGGFHRWERAPFHENNVPYADQNWNRLYKHIAVLNVILEKVKEFSDDPLEEQLQVKGESYFLRAAYYFLLVNIYAKPYDVATAQTTLGIPLKIVPQVEDKNFSRSSVKEIYDQIVSDLNESVACFEGLPTKSIHRAGEASALTLLSRVYCYMGKWDAVEELCNKVLKKGYTLTDLNTHDPAGHFTDQYSPEIIFTMGGYAWGQISERVKFPDRTMSTFTLSNELQYHLFSEKDLRPAAFFAIAKPLYVDQSFLRPAKYKADITSGKPVSDNFLIRLSEVYLNKAEALAMTGKDQDAIRALQELRAKRFKPGDLDEPQLSGEALLQFIRDERRRELCFEGHRWFDLRRYAVSPKFATEKVIRHDFYVYNPSTMIPTEPGFVSGYYQLGKYSEDPDGYVLPIPDSEIEMSEGSLINNERPERPLINL